MEIEQSVYQRVTSLLEQAHGKAEAEFEVRFWNPGFERIEISEERFRKIFEYYTFKRENDGLECAYTTTSTLDICVTSTGNTYSSLLDRTRLTIEGTQQIKKYWMQGNLEGIPYTMIEKRKLEKLDLPEYFIRITLNEELPEANIYPKNRAILLNQANNAGAGATLKHFRLKNRYKITTPDGLFSIELTTLKSGNGRNFKEANILKMAPTYEVEIEYLGDRTEAGSEVSEAVTTSLFEHVNTILSIINDTDFVIKQSIKSDVLRSYQALIHVRHDQPSYSNEMKPEFICANPVTIHRSNLLKSANVQNICNRYAVSIKADGMRMIAYVLPSTKPEMNGRIFLININDEVIDTGLRDPTYVNSIVEGEYVELSDKSGHEFYAYDMMFDRGNDIRRRQYYNTYTEPAMRSRSVHLEGFIRSGTRVTVEGMEPSAVPFKRKEYLVSAQADGMDIFAKAHEIWEKRTYQTFYVDGLIFTPMYEHYPLKGGSWYSLFKWKPENLNTIDFLIRVMKSEEGVELRYPYMDSTLRPDGGVENVLRQYKRIKLYVGTFRDAFNEKAHKMTKRKYEILFNPYDLSEEEASAYHIAHVFVDEDGKMMAKDPISGEESTIYDETIVEFGFDGTREKGFQWVPYRMRHDKTASYKGGRHVYGNLDKTANDIFRSLHYPVTEEMVTTGRVPIEPTTGMAVGAPGTGQGQGQGQGQGPYYAAMKEGNNDSARFPYQNFHNHYIKYALFSQVSPAMMEGIKTMKGKILDLCSGKGVDVAKMKRALYAEVVGIDIDYDNVKFSQQYYDRVIPKPKPKAYFVRGDSGKLVFPNFDIASTESDRMQLQKYIPIRHYFDVVSVQFALHYFFDSEISIRTLLQNANDNLKIGGHFIGTCFDGARIYEMLKGVDQVEGKTFSEETLWKIQRKYKVTRMAFDASKPNFGKQIDVYVKSIGNVHSEYLVNFAYLDRLLGEYGFQRIAVKPFYDHYDDLLKSEYEEAGAGAGSGSNANEKIKNLDNAKRMSEEEQRFSFLNNSFVYQKVENTSDALFKKLVKMMADKAKKTVTKGVEVMNEETAHLETAVQEGFSSTGGGEGEEE